MVPTYSDRRLRMKQVAQGLPLAFVTKGKIRDVLLNLGAMQPVGVFHRREVCS